MKPELNEETLTAYALGELDDDSRAAIEQELATNPDAREIVEEIRAVGELATAAFSEEVKTSETERTLTYEALAGVETSASEPADHGTVTRFRMSRSAFALAAMALICVGIFAALYPSAKTSFRTQLAKFSQGDGMAPNTQGQQAISPNDPRREISELESHDEAASQPENSSSEASWWQEFKRNVLYLDDGSPAREIQQEPRVRVDDLTLTYSDSAGTAGDVSDTDAELSPVRVAADRPTSEFDVFSEFNVVVTDTGNDSTLESGNGGFDPRTGDGVRAEGQTDMVFGGALQRVGGDGRAGGLQNVEVGGSARIRAGNTVTLLSAAPEAIEESLQRNVAESAQFAKKPADSAVGGVALSEPRAKAKPNAEADFRAFIPRSPQSAPPSGNNGSLETKLGIRLSPQNDPPPRSSFGKDIISHKAIPPLNQPGPGVPETAPVLGFDFQDQLNERKEERILVADRPDAPPVAPVPPAPQVSPGSETYSFIQDNPFIAVSRQPLSTFSIDVDTASYSNMRRFLTQNTRPPKNAVRVEELINYFSYDYAPPEGEDPFSANIEVASSPWNQGTRLVRIGLKGSELSSEERPPTNLVFLIDVSGSMRPANKLPLLKQGLAMLARQMREEDRVAMVVYAGNSGLVLPSTAGNQQSAILGALERLNAGGSTNGGAGIELAYNTAVQNFIPGGVNRVVLATDGDFNVGVTNRNALVNLIEAKAKSGVFLSVLGFGMGNLQDDNLEGLANKGNGNYAYIDTLREARKVLVEEMAGTLVTIAKDVKIQVEFNPAQVKAYRLVGYENRLLAARDFNDDTKDAGEIGAGHTVTALYEIVSKDGVFPTAGVDALKYQTPQPAKTEIVEDQGDGELLTVKLRYKQPEGNTSKLLEFPVMDEGAMLGQASTDFRFATSVAGFGMLLRNGTSNAQGLNFESVRSLAQSALGEDRHGYRAEFLSLVDQARQLITPQQYSSGSVILKGIYVRGGGAVVQLGTPQGDFRLGQGEQGGGYQILSIDASAGCVDVLNVSTGQRSRICI